MGNQNHLRNKGMQMSYLEERILDALFMLALVEMRGRGVTDYQPSTYFKGRAIAEVIGGGWTTFRKRLMLQIESHGWIEITQLKEGYFYALTQTGYITLNDRIKRASQHYLELSHPKALEGETAEFFKEQIP